MIINRISNTRFRLVPKSTTLVDPEMTLDGNYALHCIIERLLHACENELDWLDLAINFKKSCCVRIGPRYDATCVPIASLSGHLISCIHGLMRYDI